MMDPHDEHDEALGLLEEIEITFRRMIAGIFRFVCVQMPRWLYESLKDVAEALRRLLRYALKVGVRLTRATFFASLWGTIVFGPLVSTRYVRPLEHPAFKAGGAAWAGICLAGSIWGLGRWRARRGLAGGAAACVAVFCGCSLGVAYLLGWVPPNPFGSGQYRVSHMPSTSGFEPSKSYVVAVAVGAAFLGAIAGLSYHAERERITTSVEMDPREIAWRILAYSPFVILWGWLFYSLSHPLVYCGIGVYLFWSCFMQSFCTGIQQV